MRIRIAALAHCKIFYLSAAIEAGLLLQILIDGLCEVLLQRRARFFRHAISIQHMLQTQPVLRLTEGRGRLNPQRRQVEQQLVQGTQSQPNSR